MSDGTLTRRSLLSASPAVLAGRARGASRRPNFILLMADDHPNRAVGCYGSNVNRTPHIDRIARQGMRFDHAYVTTSLCSPSRASILTGKYAHVNGAYRKFRTA